MSYDEVDQLLPLFVLGRKIGTYTGWDQADTFAIQIYNFIPAEGINLPATDNLTIDLGTGKAVWFTGDGVPEYGKTDDEGWEEKKEYRWQDHYHWRDIVDIVEDVKFNDLDDEKLPQDPLKFS